MIKRWFIKHIYKHIWWRLYYKKVKFSVGWLEYGKCVCCHARCKVNSSDCEPLCNTYKNICPCKNNECLIYRNL